MKVILLGAGHIGQTIARLLCASGDYTLRVVDRTAELLAALDGLACTTMICDIEVDAALAGALEMADCVINALPFHCAERVAGAAKAAGCHYFDLTEGVAPTREIRRLAEGAATAFMPQCG